MVSVNRTITGIDTSVAADERRSKARRLGRFAVRLWKKAPSLDRMKGIKGALQDLWRVAENANHLVNYLKMKGFFDKIGGGRRPPAGTPSGAPSLSTGGKATVCLYKAMNKLNRSIRWIKLLSIVSVPFMLKGIAKKVHAIVVGRPGRVDNFLWATNDMGGVCHNVTGFVNGLVAVGVVSATRVGFLGPLSIVASVLCLAGPLAMARGMVQTFVFSRKFDKALHFEKDGSITDDNFNRALDFLIAQQNLPRKKRDRHHYMLGKHFAYNGTVLNKQLTEIRQHSDGLNTADKSALMKRLRGRVTVKQASTVFGIANGLIGFAACPVFVLAPIYCPPLIPLGFVFGGLNAGGQAVRFFIDWYTEHRFEKSVKGFAAKAAPAV